MPATTPLRLPKRKAGPGSISDASSSISDALLPSKRRCIGNACEACRKRKIRCDGIKPSCYSCYSVYKTDCNYDLDNDNRRKGALRKEIRTLETEGQYKTIIIEGVVKSSDAKADKMIHILRANPYEHLESMANIVQNVSLGKEIDPTLEGQERADPGLIIDSFTGRSRNSDVNSYSDLSMISADYKGPWTTVTTDDEFITHLLHLYFAWAHPFSLLFSEETFWHGYEGKKLKHCSPILVNALLSLACNFTDREEARSDINDHTTIGDHFFAEAERLLFQDGRFCLTSVQALGIMSTRQAMKGSDTSGWVFLCQMMDMAIDLGLHLSCNGPATTDLSSEEVEIRRITLWGCHVLETSWVMFSGRVSNLPRSQIRTEKIVPSFELDKVPWRPFNDRSEPEHISHFDQPGFRYTLLLYLGDLSEIVSDMVQTSCDSSKLGLKLRAYHHRYQQWYGQLPEVLLLNQYASDMPQVLTLHIYYHSCLCRLFLPFMGDPTKTSTQSSRRICTDEATSVLHLVRMYSNTYGLRRGSFIITHCVTTAAIIFLLHISLEATLIIAIRATESLLEAITMLREMSTAFPIVAQHLEGIRELVKQRGIVNLPDSLRRALYSADIALPNLSGGTSSSNPQITSSSSVFSSTEAVHPEIREDKPDSGDPESFDMFGIVTTESEFPAWAELPEGIFGMQQTADEILSAAKFEVEMRDFGVSPDLNDVG